MKIAPSILSCDFANMGSEIIKVSNAGADLIHIDVMDGHFVPNITLGPSIIKSIRKYTKLPFDVHLMIDNPAKYIDDFAKAGSDIITCHLESDKNILITIESIKKYNIKVGLSVKPATPIEDIFPYLDKIDMVLIMTVEPGFGGQSFMSDMMKKVTKLKNEINNRNLSVLIEVDGGINFETVQIAAKNGVDICVAGTSVFKEKDYKEAISQLKM